MTPAVPQSLPVVLLTPKQAAEVCQVGRPVIDTWSHQPGFPVIRDGRIVRIPLDQLREWLAARAAQTNAQPAELAPRIARMPVRRQG